MANKRRTDRDNQIKSAKTERNRVFSLFLEQSTDTDKLGKAGYVPIGSHIIYQSCRKTVRLSILHQNEKGF